MDNAWAWVLIHSFLLFYFLVRIVFYLWGDWFKLRFSRLNMIFSCNWRKVYHRLWISKLRLILRWKIILCFYSWNWPDRTQFIWLFLSLVKVTCIELILCGVNIKRLWQIRLEFLFFFNFSRVRFLFVMFEFKWLIVYWILSCGDWSCPF